MLREHLVKIHIIELIPAQNKNVVKPMVQKVNHVLAHRIGRTLKPGGIRECLLGS